MRESLAYLRAQWSGSSGGLECSLHQLAPYIGKLKTSIARALISRYSRPRSTILEPFSGSGVVALEALLQNRDIIANDISPYAAVLTRAKLFAPTCESIAAQKASELCQEAKRIARRNGWALDAPTWVKRFFHPQTLAEVHALAQVLRRRQEWFLLACLLGILHHQRPGFLSYPSSHLVPYLRHKKFPRARYPELYRYRDVESRLRAKIHRAYRRPWGISRTAFRRFESREISALRVRKKVDLVLTSPPYMNALDYGRDNRLRLWLLGVDDYREIDQRNCRTPDHFSKLIQDLATAANRCLTPDGLIVLVVGEARRNNQRTDTSEIAECVLTKRNRFELIDRLEDPVPDIRRSRRGCAGTKREWILVFSRR